MQSVRHGDMLFFWLREGDRWSLMTKDEKLGIFRRFFILIFIGVDLWMNRLEGHYEKGLFHP